LNYGLRTAEKNLLFAHLPIVSADAAALRLNDDLLGSDDSLPTRQLPGQIDQGTLGISGQWGGPTPSTWQVIQRATGEELILARERANRLARLVDLRNANAKGIMHENRRRIVEAFGENREDTGKPEVQGETYLLHVLFPVRILTHAEQRRS
jgi:small subunit ribosomal protein S15